jgi:hypothetical protein
MFLGLLLFLGPGAHAAVDPVGGDHDLLHLSGVHRLAELVVGDLLGVGPGEEEGLQQEEEGQDREVVGDREPHLRLQGRLATVSGGIGA